ncbi:MAG: peptidoglycan DD-metalloendopeptidase family protein [Magnetococcales bacterium]|nr:peptidoglycan DD-metalloendopeptidase family protein [Magnetococcales bacterium]
MKTHHAVEQQGRRWYGMMVGIIGCLLLIHWSIPLCAAEIRGGKKQPHLAERARLMYGLKGGKMQSRKPQRSTAVASVHRRVQVRAVAGNARISSAVRTSAGKKAASGLRTPLVKRHSAALHGGKGKRWSAALHTAGTKKQSGNRHKRLMPLQKERSADPKNGPASGQATKGLFAASAERRMGTFTEPLPVPAVARSSGLFFRAAENGNVLASSRGQVVYAGWFRGYGLLAILNHGGRIYSLYGHNRDLLVTKGEFVEPGQVIAKSGKTGSVDGVPGLYFEIRKGNKPENPRRWLVRERRYGDKMASLLE